MCVLRLGWLWSCRCLDGQSPSAPPLPPSPRWLRREEDVSNSAEVWNTLLNVPALMGFAVAADRLGGISTRLSRSAPKALRKRGGSLMLWVPGSPGSPAMAALVCESMGSCRMLGVCRISHTQLIKPGEGERAAIPSLEGSTPQCGMDRGPVWLLVGGDGWIKRVCFAGGGRDLWLPCGALP